MAEHLLHHRKAPIKAITGASQNHLCLPWRLRAP